MLQDSEFGCFYCSSPRPATHSRSNFRSGGRGGVGVFPSEEPFFLILVIGQVGLSRAVKAISAKTSKHGGTLLNCVPQKMLKS